MDIRNLKQVDLVNKTHLDKTLINKYLAGLMKAKQDKLTILSEALNVNEVWLMGYDVPMEMQTEIKQSGSDIYYTDPNTKETHFITWPPHRLSYEQLYVFIDEQFVFTIFNNGVEIPYEFYHIRVEDDSINLIAPIRKNTSCSQAKYFKE